MENSTRNQKYCPTTVGQWIPAGYARSVTPPSTGSGVYYYRKTVHSLSTFV